MGIYSPTTAQLFSSPNSTQLHTDLPSSSVFFATASEEIIKKDRQHGGQIFLLIDNVQSKWETGANRVCIECCQPRCHCARNQGYKRNCSGHRKEVIFSPYRSPVPLESQPHHPKHRYGLLRNGSRLQSVGRQGAQSLSHRLQENLQRVPPNENISAGCSKSDARSYAVRRCTAIWCQSVDCWLG